MSVSLWPPLPSDERIRREEESLANELAWYLSTLPSTLTTLSSGLNEVATLLSPTHTPTTLALSSHRSESLKGFVTRHGARIVKGDVNVRLATLPPPKGQPAFKLSISSAPDAPALVLDQLITVQNHIAAALDVIDIARYTGDASDPVFMAGQLRLLGENIREAKAALKGSASSTATGYSYSHEKTWWEDPLDERTLVPRCPAHVSFHLSIADAALVLHVRTLEAIGASSSSTSSRPRTPAPASNMHPSSHSNTHPNSHPNNHPANSNPHSNPNNSATLHPPTTHARPSTDAARSTPSGTSTPVPGSAADSITGFNLRERLAAAIGAGPRVPAHDEAGELFAYRGQDVRVREKVRVESQDPVLLSAAAKISALEHGVRVARHALATLMLEDEDEEETEGEER